MGGIVINRSLDQVTKEKVNRLIKKSVEYAFANPKSALEFIKQHAQEMSEEVMYKHIDLYVNQYSVELGIEGRKAIDVMFKMAQEKGIISPIKQNIYLIA
ncbi:1,4-dihydroxy-6-naphtoate synthase [compost metagenome]